jgi:hypothetical protein
VADKGARNDLSAAVPKFCLAIEEYRRTPEGRVRTSLDLLATFFPHDEKTCQDKLLKYLPSEVRGPIVAAWGIRGIKAALRDPDDKIQQVVHDALVAGDVDHQAFEDGLTPETLVRWLPLADIWAFWRGGKLTKQAIQKAMATAYELYLFDARWFLDTLTAKGGTLRGTDVLADGLAKEDLTQWVKRIHETGDGSPKGIVGALGWDKIVARTSNDILVSALDAVVAKVGLVVAPARESSPKAVAEAAGKPEPAPPAAPSLDPEKTAPATNVATSDKPADDGAWSMPPAAPDPGAASDDINVVVDDSALTGLSSPTAPRIRAASPLDEEDTEVKAVPRVRSERPPARGAPPGGGQRSR